MLIDFHAHSSGISKCCKIDGKNMLIVAKNKGIDGVVLTNHYNKSYVISDSKDLAIRYVNEYLYVKSCGEELGIKVFFGIEVTMDKHNDVHMLIYGVDCDFLLKYHDLFDYDQEKLFKLVKENNGILSQAHPLRRGKNVLLNLEFLDGVEINCHPLYDGTYLEFFNALAYDNNLILTCGGDFHNDTHRVKCGIYLDDSLNTMNDIVKYLKSTDNIKLCIQENNSFESFDYTFVKRKTHN